jgi:hypothetical protein
MLAPKCRCPRTALAWRLRQERLLARGGRWLRRERVARPLLHRQSKLYVLPLLLKMEHRSMRNMSRQSWCAAPGEWSMASVADEQPVHYTSTSTVFIEYKLLSFAEDLQNNIFDHKRFIMRLSEGKGRGKGKGYGGR